MNAHLAAVRVLIPLGLACSAVCVGTPLRAQGVPERDAMFARYLDFANLVTGGIVQPRWMADGNRFWYVAGRPEETVVYKVDPVAGTQSPLFDTERVRRALAGLLGHQPPHAGLPFRSFQFTDKTESAIAFSVESQDFVLVLDGYSVTRTPAQSEAEKRRTTAQPIRKRMSGNNTLEVASPDKRWFATEKDHGLWLRSASDGAVQPLISDGKPGYAWSVDQAYWQVDLARWSPDSARLAAFKVDTRQTDSLPLGDWLGTGSFDSWPFSKPGRPIPRTELHIVDVASKTSTVVQTGSDEHWLHTIGWTPDGSALLFLRMRRDCRQLDLMTADPRTGAARVVVSETQKTFVEGVNWRLLRPTLLADGKRFVWPSERDGWNHLYLYSLDGALIRRLTAGEWPVMDLKAVDSAGEWVYFTARAEPRIYDTHLYRVRLDGSGFARLTEATGQHIVEMSPSRQYFVDTHSTPARPETTELRGADGRLIRTVATTDTRPLAELKWKAPEEFVVKAGDGKTDLHGLLFKPYDFDPGRRYPVIDYIAGGPEYQWVLKFFTTNRALEAQALAQLGFITVMVDGRGTPGRSKAFQDVGYKKFGTHVVPEHVAVLEQLARERSYMDLQRVGLVGGQWPGAYMAIRGMLTAPHVYRVGIGRLATRADLSGLRAAVIEPYMGLLQDDPAAYEAASSLPDAGKLEGKLLLIVEPNDLDAPLGDVLKMVAAFNKAGKRYDLILNPERPADYRTYYMNVYRQYLQEHLLASRRPAPAQ